MNKWWTIIMNKWASEYIKNNKAKMNILNEREQIQYFSQVWIFEYSIESVMLKYSSTIYMCYLLLLVFNCKTSLNLIYLKCIKNVWWYN